jgi:hypothetical protein
MEINTMLKGQAICKDCGNGTLDNEMNTQFELVEVGDSGMSVAACLMCGSGHVDGELYLENEEA